jgi:hypothetical protein
MPERNLEVESFGIRWAQSSLPSEVAGVHGAQDRPGFSTCAPADAIG